MAEVDSAPSLSSRNSELSAIGGSSFGSPNSFSSSSSSSDTEEDANHRYPGSLYRPYMSERGIVFYSGGDQSVPCITVLAVLWCIVSVSLISLFIGFYGPTNMWIGPNSSILFEPNPIFVRGVKVKQLDDSKSGLQLIGFYRSPSLDLILNWSESRFLSVSPRSLKAWPYYLNKGTSFNISYTVISQGSSVQLMVAEHVGGISSTDYVKCSQLIGLEGVSQGVLDKPVYQSSALSFNRIRGSGMIELKISKASSYFIAVSNSNAEEVKVELDIDMSAVLYDTKQSFYKCNLSNGGECTFNAMSLVGNSLVLTSPPWRQEASIEDWYITYSYQPTYITYIIGIGVVTCFVLVVIQFWKMICGGGDDSEGSQRRRLLEDKDDGGSSVGSSNESFAADDADLEDFMGVEGEGSRRLCAVCFDAPRDCFFLPCSHCVSCYQCGTRVAEAGGNCPICRRKMNKVKRIFTV